MYTARAAASAFKITKRETRYQVSAEKKVRVYGGMEGSIVHVLLKRSIREMLWLVL